MERTGEDWRGMEWKGFYFTLTKGTERNGEEWSGKDRRGQEGNGKERKGMAWFTTR